MIQRFIALCLLAASGCIPVPGVENSRQDVSTLKPAAFRIKLADDIHALRIIDERTDSLKSRFSSFFSTLQLADSAPLTADQRTTVMEAWALYLDMARVLQNIVLDHRRFYRLPEQDMVDSYLAGYAAYLYLYAGGLFIVEHTMDRVHFETLLDEAAPAYGIPAGQYARLKKNIISISDISNLPEGYDAFGALCRKHGRETWQGDRAWLAERIEYKYGYCEKKLTAHAVSYVADNALDILKDRTLELIFPVQKGIAELMGYTRLTSRHRGLVSKAQCKRLRLAARPGDILFERKEWYVSNMGLPGFWSHAALFLGSAAELEAWADVPAIRDLYAARDSACTGLPGYLARHYPEAWAAFTSGEKGEPYRIIEGLGEGIIFTTVAGSPGISDHVACLRPRLSAADKAQAIEKAFGYWGRSYDFNFDFLSDETVVCTELVYKAYEPAAGKAGLNLPLVKIMGTLTLPANRIIEQFDTEYETTPQFDFILYFEGDEKETGALEQDVVAFRRSHYKPGWR